MRSLSHEIGVGQNGQDTPKNVFVKRMLNIVVLSRGGVGSNKTW